MNTVLNSPVNTPVNPVGTCCTPTGYTSPVSAYAPVNTTGQVGYSQYPVSPISQYSPVNTFGQGYTGYTQPVNFVQPFGYSQTPGFVPGYSPISQGYTGYSPLNTCTPFTQPFNTFPASTVNGLNTLPYSTLNTFPYTSPSFFSPINSALNFGSPINTPWHTPLNTFGYNTILSTFSPISPISQFTSPINSWNSPIQNTWSNLNTVPFNTLPYATLPSNSFPLNTLPFNTLPINTINPFISQFASQFSTPFTSPIGATTPWTNSFNSLYSNTLPFTGQVPFGQFSNTLPFAGQVPGISPITQGFGYNTLNAWNTLPYSSQFSPVSNLTGYSPIAGFPSFTGTQFSSPSVLNTFSGQPISLLPTSVPFNAFSTIPTQGYVPSWTNSFGSYPMVSQFPVNTFNPYTAVINPSQINTVNTDNAFGLRRDAA